MGPKRVASRVRGRGYDTALLLTNSFSTRWSRAGVHPAASGLRPRRPRHAADRSHRAERSPRGGYAPGADGRVLPARAEAVLVRNQRARGRQASRHEARTRGHARAGRAAAEPGVRAGGLGGSAPHRHHQPRGEQRDQAVAGGSLQVAAHLATRGMDIAINGSPAERELAAEVAAETRRPRPPRASPRLPALGITIGASRASIRARR